MIPARLNAIFFIAGLVGLPLCSWGWLHFHRGPWLIGVGLFTYFVTSSVVQAIIATRRDVRAWRAGAAPAPDVASRQLVGALRTKPLTADPYFRAGAMGVPFCTLEWFYKHELIFLLGGGFFTALLLSSIYLRWRAQRSSRKGHHE